MFYFPFHIWDVILPIDELIFFRGVGIPPTSFCLLWFIVCESMFVLVFHLDMKRSVSPDPLGVWNLWNCPNLDVHPG